MGRLAKWEPIDRVALEREERALSSEGGADWAKIGEGKNVFRFLPRKRGWPSHLKTVHKHFVKDVPGRKNTLTFVCPRRQLKPPQPCPECDRAFELQNSTNPVDRDSAKSFFPKSQAIANVIDRSRQADGPLLIGLCKTIVDSLKEIENDDDDGGDYTDPTDRGFDIIITRRGKQLDTEYKVKPARSNSPLSEDPDEADEWIANQHDLDEQAVCMDIDDLNRALRGEKPSRSSRQLPPARSRRADDDDEEEDRPRRRRLPARRAEPEDEERDEGRGYRRMTVEDEEPGSERPRRKRLPARTGRKLPRRSIRHDIGDED